MNDFTKQELKELIMWTTYLAGHNPELKKKITSMINNYCEHEPSEPILVLNKQCTKCNCHLETRPWG